MYLLLLYTVHVNAKNPNFVQPRSAKFRAIGALKGDNNESSVDESTENSSDEIFIVEKQNKDS